MDEAVEEGVGEVEFGGDGYGAAGGECGGDVVEQGGESHWGFHCGVMMFEGWLRVVLENGEW